MSPFLKPFSVLSIWICALFLSLVGCQVGQQAKAASQVQTSKTSSEPVSAAPKQTAQASIINSSTSLPSSLRDEKKLQVLFLDFNNAPLEIEAVGRYAQVTVIPSSIVYPSEVRRQIAKLTDDNTEAETLRNRCTDNYVSLDCKRYHSRFPNDDAYWGFIEMTGKSTRNLVTEARAAKVWEELKNTKTNYDVVVMSGHHSNGYIGGELVSAIHFQMLKEFIGQNPVLLKSPKAFFIFGCESGSQKMLETWGSLFSGLQLILASNGVAPLKTDSTNIKFISDLFLKLKKSQVYGDSFLPNQYVQAQDFLMSLKRPRWPAAMLWKEGRADSTDFFYIK